VRFEIDATPIGPLSLMSELPDSRFSILEGLNGIGKSLSVRLLELCTGTRPYRQDSPAWISLCKGLGPFRVTVTGLNEAREIVWAADSRDWLKAEPGVYPQFDTLTLDGNECSIEELRRVLTVHRIAGDEGIVETFAQQADNASEIVRRWSRRHTGTEASPLANMEEVIGDAALTLGEWTAARLHDVERSASEAKRVVDECIAAREKSLERRDRLQELQQAVRLLGDTITVLPDLVLRRDEIDVAIGELNQKRELIQNQMTALAARVGAAEPVLRELENARRTLARNRDKLSEQVELAASISSELGVPPTDDAAKALVVDLRAQLAALEAERDALHTAPVMRQLLDGLASELHEAEHRGLADQVALDDGDVQLTVTQTRAGMLSRRSYLEGQPPPPEARRVDDQITRLQRVLSRTVDLEEAFAEAARRQRLVGENEDRVDAAVAATEPGALDEMRRLEDARREADEELLGLATERATLRQRLGTLGDGRSPDELEERIEADARTLGIDSGSVEQAIAQEEEALARAQARAAAATSDNEVAQREVGRAHADLRRVAAQISNGAELAWLRRALPASMVPSTESEANQQAAAIDSVRSVLTLSTDRLGEFRVQVAALESALREVARHLRGQSQEAVRYVPEMQHWFGERFSDWFNTPGVKTELLPEARGRVSVDLAGRQVGWSDAGSGGTRPLEAFSSGEQAFAYTRVRLGLIDDDDARPANRLIVLDEFGAFIAHDRLSGLITYIRERATKHSEDQVLLVLPLNRDYATMAESAVGSEQKRLLKLASEVEANKYAVQVLVP
jgi:hypothetical protein